MRRFTVRETSPGINYMEPDKPIYWHLVGRSTDRCGGGSFYPAGKHWRP
ncbi:hypothetical protein PMI42_00120 [Bradyrhizobium sp. YR681]|nr:hypothetical protein PMI42_00120 [Bradyrhizobium sp. YR681]